MAVAQLTILSYLIHFRHTSSHGEADPVER